MRQRNPTKLCAMEEARLQSRLKEPLTEQNRDAFICAAAWMAPADYFAGKGNRRRRILERRRCDGA